MPLVNLYKTPVSDLARYRNIPPRIREKPPSPDILPGIVNEEAIGIPYQTLDLILVALEKGWEMNEIAPFVGVTEKKGIYLKTFIQESEYMRKLYMPGDVSSILSNSANQ